MTLSKRTIWILTIALATLVLLTVLVAPGGNQRQDGSTYGRSPNGYGAWYADMERRGTPVQRWQKPLNQLPGIAPTSGQSSGTVDAQRGETQPITLLRIGNDVTASATTIRNWVRQGNVLILLGERVAVSRAPFSSSIASEVGAVKVETTRREQSNKFNARLEDAYGSVVWQETWGQGRIILASTPYLAANAYQDNPANFALLTKLVTEAGNPIWVDEYMHGYKDADVLQQETHGNLIAYLSKTPLVLVGIQAIVMLAVLIWGQNQRMGRAIALPNPVTDNSEAYIQAMGAVLRKAHCSEFVIETLGKAEQLQIQRALGVGTDPLPTEALIDAWVQQTGRSPSELETVLRSAQRHRRISEVDLLRWLESVQAVRRHLPK